MIAVVFIIGFLFCVWAYHAGLFAGYPAGNHPIPFAVAYLIGTGIVAYLQFPRRKQ